MARAQVVHSEDAATIIFKGDKRFPEPTTGIIKFPGGRIEVARTTDGSYWVHTSVEDAVNIKDSRVDYNHDGWCKNGILPVPDADKVRHIAIRIYPDVIEITGE